LLEKLQDGLRGTLKKISNALFVDEKLINELIKDLQRTLISSDVSVKLVFELTKKIKSRIMTEDTPKGLTKKEFLVNVLYEELTNFLGGEGFKINLNKKPFILMLVGLFGNGKTTHAGKIAKFFSKRGKKVLCVQTDTWRPAAYKQLETLAKQGGADFVGNVKAKNPQDIINAHKKDFNKYDLVIIDTAGRDSLNDELIDELKEIQKVADTNETLLTIAADVGQSAEKQAKVFKENCNVTGVIITKMDGTAKGGGALTACAITGAPVKFIGVGEKIDDLEEFDPKRFVGILLGMGDLEGLLEKAKEAINIDDAQDLGKRLLKGEFSLLDLYEQMNAMSKMGPLTKVMGMIPGMGGLNIPKEALETQQEKLTTWKVIMDSCTKAELENPEIIHQKKIERISKGSGISGTQIREMLAMHKKSKKMMKSVKGQLGGGDFSEKKMENMMKKSGGMQGMMKQMAGSMRKF
jgi:signal recognition particle subunit SRP54